MDPREMLQAAKAQAQQECGVDILRVDVGLVMEEDGDRLVWFVFSREGELGMGDTVEVAIQDLRDRLQEKALTGGQEVEGVPC